MDQEDQNGSIGLTVFHKTLVSTASSWKGRVAQQGPAYLLEEPRFLLQDLTLAQFADLVRAAVGTAGTRPAVF